MSKSPIERLAEARAIQLSAELEVQLSRDADPKMQPVIAILALARRDAFVALDALVHVGVTANSMDTISELQREVRRYEDLVEWIQEIITEGREIDTALSAEEREEFFQLFNGPQFEAERLAMGATPGEDA